MSGFYLLHRGWQDNPVFRNEAYSRRDAFVWMVEQAAYAERRVAGPRGEIALQRGQFSHSLRFMARAWKWDEARVRRFVSALVVAQIIDAATDAGQMLVTVCNYDKYQTPSAAPDAATAAAATQQRRGGDAKKKEGNEGKEGKEGSPKGDTRGRVVIAEKPLDVEAQVWADFQRLREKKRAPLTETALKGIAREAAKVPGLTLNDALALCCERGWQGLKAEWVKEDKGGRRGNGSGWINA